ncbi:MAG TPA: amino acid adenylation domain-containing protein [Verrucomicrobiales bacterium]|nr:amino acid adenylation domain-containing protein [Verrucomicrobiales bacterium]
MTGRDLPQEPVSTAPLTGPPLLDRASSIAERFESIVARFPQKVAIHTLEGDITYAELNARANRWAHTLLQRTERTPQRIALLFDQGAPALAAAFGTLKAGHAFVPLDASDPAARLQAIVRDCHPAAIVAESKHAKLAASLSQGPTDLLLDSEPGVPSSTANPGLPTPEETLAYLFYTSGSTGQPKGVCQTHRNLLHYIRAYSACLGIKPDDRLSLLYSLSFSASNMDVFGALLQGAALCPYDIRRRGTASLGDWLNQQSITILHAVPTVFRHLLQNLTTRNVFPSIRAVDLGGEAVYPTDIDLFRACFRKECLLVNHLAATEISVIAQYRIDLDASYQTDILPVGYPPSHTIIRILRPDGSEAVSPEQGEMVVHSPFLSPGYWERPDLTQKAFADYPSRPGWRAYRSGDLGYVDGEGRLIFLGRKDHRVKIRGHSVDIAEVEAALRETSWIRDLAVVAVDDTGTNHSLVLVAYFESEPAGQKAISSLRQELQRRLPPYMMPSDLVWVERLPVTSSGKIDRRALAALPRPSAAGDAPPLDAMQTEGLEHSVQTLFRSLLRRSSVEPSDDFFSLGGDSLKATQLHQQLERLSGIAIPLEELLRNSTISGITAFVRRMQTLPSAAVPAVHPCLVALRRSGSKPPLFLTHGAKGQAFVSPHFLEILGSDQPVYAYQATGLERCRMPRNSIVDMAAEYLRALRAVQPEGPYFLGSICVGGVVTLEMAQQAVSAGDAVGPLLLIDPPKIPPGERPRWKRWKRLLRTRWKQLRLRPSADAKLRRDLQKKNAQGRIVFDAGNPDAVARAALAARDFRIALLHYRLKPYPGPVLILASSGRRSDDAEIQRTRQHYQLTGPVEFFRVEGKHEELHDVHNEQFERQLRNCMRAAWSAFENVGG